MFKEMAPYVVVFTILICLLFVIRLRKKHISTIDGLMAIAGCGAGLVITSLNLIYSNNYMITIGPLACIASLLYLVYREKVRGFSIINPNIGPTTAHVIRMLFWICILIVLISYFTSPLYSIQFVFYISISLAIALLGLDIITIRSWDNGRVFAIIVKILTASLIFRAGNFYISVYPIGSDTWVHAEIIESIFQMGTTSTAIAQLSNYIYYPLMHIYVVVGMLVNGYSIKDAMFMIGAVLAISTIFVYLLVKKIFNSEMLALLSMLMVSFADFNIQWSELIIAMSLGIALYTLLLYLVLTRRKYEKLDIVFIIWIFAVLILTHTVSSFIALISIISLYIGIRAYRYIYGDDGEKPLLNFKICLLLTVILMGYWAYIGSQFLWAEFEPLIYSLTSDAEFLGRSASLVGENLNTILNILGFLMLIFFGIIGCLTVLSKKYAKKSIISIIIMSLMLFTIFFIFPILGIRNIVPYRWPAFIYSGFVVFGVIGILCFISLIGSFVKNSNKAMAMAFMALVFVYVFFMITNDITNPPTPIYGSELNQMSFWTDSEMASFRLLNDSYDGVICTDLQTFDRPFRVYLNRTNVSSLWLTPSGNIDWDIISDDLIVWRKVSEHSIVQARLGIGEPDVFLGPQFKVSLDKNFSTVFDAGTTRGYLKLPTG